MDSRALYSKYEGELQYFSLMQTKNDTLKVSSDFLKMHAVYSLWKKPNQSLQTIFFV